MKKFLAAVAVFVALTIPGLCMAADYASVPSFLQQHCVTVLAENASGSGTVIVRDVEGVKTAFVWTAYHVVDGLREVKSVLKDGREIKVVSYRDAQIVQELLYEGATVGDHRLNCKVLICSPKTDIALLQIRMPGTYTEGVEFDLTKQVTPVGLDVMHCGSPSGKELGHNSVTTGIIAANGRMFDGLAYDQTTVSALPGSSGGIVARRDDAAYVGMLTLGLRGTDTFNYIVPARRIVEWCEKTGVLWAVDPTAPVPTKKQLEELKVEDTMINPDAAKATGEAPQGFRYWIGTVCEPTPAVEASVLFGG